MRRYTPFYRLLSSHPSQRHFSAKSSKIFAWSQPNNCHSAVGSSHSAKDADAALKNAILLGRSRSARLKQKSTVLDGADLIKLAFDFEMGVTAVFHAQHNCQADELLSTSSTAAMVKDYHISQQQKQSLAAQGITSDIFGICRIPQDTPVRSAETLPITVIGDNIRDPNNMANVILSSVASKCQRIILTKGCVDVWDPKIVKAAHGAHFFIGLHTDCDWSDISSLVSATEHNCRIFVCDAATTDRTDGLPDVYNYSTLTYTDHHIVLIVGGETEGISSMAYQFCRSRNGVRVHIPMAAVIDSLNCAVSVGIVLNEIRRQLMHAPEYTAV